MDITLSVRSLMENEQTVIRSFYDRFISRSPEIARLFEGVDLDQQAEMLTSALLSVQLNYAHRLKAVRRYLRVLGKRHFGKNIPKEFYPDFRECILETLSEFHGKEWDDYLAREWHDALEIAFGVMFEAYDS